MSGIKGANAGEKQWNYKHGCTKTRLFREWQHMIERCEYEKHPHYKDYGGRRILLRRRTEQFGNSEQLNL